MFKKIIQYYYNKYLINLGSGKKSILYPMVYKILEKIFIKLDPEVKVKIGNKLLFMNLSHKLPLYYYQYKNYDRALPRICKQLKGIDGRLVVIDIGANIGDTVSLITDTIEGDFLCVEGDEKYLPILEKNVGQIPTANSIKIEKSYCGEETKEKVSINRANGTAKIIKGITSVNKDGATGTFKTKSLLKIIDDNPTFKKANLLKIDTDGFEINILNSGKTFLKNEKPLIYFEFTPALYKDNGQEPDSIWIILRECGYKNALFYDNFGNVLNIIDISNQEKIKNMVDKIDNKSIYYYDILIYNENTFKYSDILKSELNNLIVKKI